MERSKTRSKKGRQYRAVGDVSNLLGTIFLQEIISLGVGDALVEVVVDHHDWGSTCLLYTSDAADE